MVSFAALSQYFWSGGDKIVSEDNDYNEAGPSGCCCATCGIAEIDDIKLKDCDSCDLVKYCSDECKEDHKLEHKEACEKRAGELRDELLFKHPEGNHHGDCPLCCLPLPIDPWKSYMHSCCSKVICNGCSYALMAREHEMRLTFKCPFCREPTKRTKEEMDKERMKRVEAANDPVAMYEEARIQHERGYYIRAFEYWTKAARLGNADAHFQLSQMYYDGEGVERDAEMMLYHFEEAAIGGHPSARHNLGNVEWNKGNYERAVKHWIIAASQGFESTDILMKKYREGYVSKEQLAAALRAHQAAVNETKSEQREAAEKFKQAVRNK